MTGPVLVLRQCVTALPILLSIFLLSGCVISSDIVAPNGYEIACDKGRDCAVAKNEHTIVVEPEVDKYCIQGQYLIGHTLPPVVTPPSPGYTPETQSQKPGFFIVDMSKNKVVTGLTESEWKTQLSKMNISDPELKPTAFEVDRYNDEMKKH